MLTHFKLYTNRQGLKFYANKRSKLFLIYFQVNTKQFKFKNNLFNHIPEIKLFDSKIFVIVA